MTSRAIPEKVWACLERAYWHIWRAEKHIAAARRLVRQ